MPPSRVTCESKRLCAGGVSCWCGCMQTCAFDLAGRAGDDAETSLRLAFRYWAAMRSPSADVLATSTIRPSTSAVYNLQYNQTVWSASQDRTAQATAARPIYRPPLRVLESLAATHVSRLHLGTTPLVHCIFTPDVAARARARCCRICGAAVAWRLSPCIGSVLIAPEILDRTSLEACTLRSCLLRLWEVPWSDPCMVLT